MKRIIIILLIITTATKCQEQRALPPSIQETKQTKIATIAAIQALQKQQKHNYYGYRQYFEQTPNSQPIDAKIPRYTEF